MGVKSCILLRKLFFFHYETTHAGTFSHLSKEGKGKDKDKCDLLERVGWWCWHGSRRTETPIAALHLSSAPDLLLICSSLSDSTSAFQTPALHCLARLLEQRETKNILTADANN